MDETGGNEAMDVSHPMTGLACMLGKRRKQEAGSSSLWQVRTGAGSLL